MLPQLCGSEAQGCRVGGHHLPWIREFLGFRVIRLNGAGFSLGFRGSAVQDGSRVVKGVGFSGSGKGLGFKDRTGSDWTLHG